MSKLLMVAGRQVQGSDGKVRLGAYVVLSAGRMSRVFSVRGAATDLRVEELPSATTIDMRRFESEIDRDLGAGEGPPSGAAVTSSRPPDAVVLAAVRAHLKKAENLDVE
jgi:hypothetical protein